MEKQKKAIESSETRVVKCVFPNTTNHYNTLFGGTALQWMDEVAFITASRFSRQKMVTVSSDRVDFKKPIPSGTFAELIGKVTMVGNSSLKVKVEIFIEQMYEVHRELAVVGEFTMVAIGDNKKTALLELKHESPTMAKKHRGFGGKLKV